MNRSGWIVPAIVLGACTASMTPSEPVNTGPFVIQAGPTSATIVWLIASGGRLRPQTVTLSGLQPGRPYDYRIGDREENAGHFKTAPVEDAPFRFVVYGDTRTRHDVHARAVAAIATHDPDFLIHTGDLVADGASVPQWSEFFALERELLRRAAFFPAIGNHEHNDPQFQEFFGAGRTRYCFRWGKAVFAVLNSDWDAAGEDARARQAFWAEQLAWLDQTLAQESQASFRFVVVHEPPITAMKKRRDNAERLAVGLIPILERYRVTALFGAHDHSYQRHQKSGVQYIVTAGAGAPLYDVDDPIPGITEKAEKTENFVVLQVEGRVARAQAFDLAGRVIDEVAMKAPQPAAVPR